IGPFPLAGPRHCQSGRCAHFTDPDLASRHSATWLILTEGLAAQECGHLEPQYLSSAPLCPDNTTPVPSPVRQLSARQIMEVRPDRCAPSRTKPRFVRA